MDLGVMHLYGRGLDLQTIRIHSTVFLSRTGLVTLTPLQ